MNFDTTRINEVINAITLIRANIKWKPRKAQSHLSKRIKLGHLPPDSSMEAYEEIINRIITDPNAKLYVYSYESFVYPTLVATVSANLWLVMIGLDGIMETAFPPEDPERYLGNSSFLYLGILEEYYYE